MNTLEIIEATGGYYQRIYYENGKPTDLFEWISTDGGDEEIQAEIEEKAKTKVPRKPSAYNIFMKDRIEHGRTFREAASDWHLRGGKP